MEVTLSDKGLLNPCLHAFAEESPVGQHKSGSTARPEELHEQHEEKIGSLASTKLSREVRLVAIFLHAAKRRVRNDDVHALLRTPVAQGPGKGIVVANVGGD